MYNFTKRARHIVEYLANTEGKRLGSDSLGPEHIFLALFKDHNCSAMKILSGLGVNIDIVQKNIEKNIPRKGSALIIGSLPQNSKFKLILDIASEEAKKLNSAYIGTEHLLFAIVRDGSIPSIQSLSNAGIDYSTVWEYHRKIQESQENDDDFAKNHKPKSGFLEEYTIDLTLLAKQGKLDPVIGREREIDRITHILCRKNKNNPVLVGEAGVGKTAIAEGLAIRIVNSSVPSFLLNKRILSLDLAAVVAGTKFRGDFEDRMKRILKEIKSDSNIIIFIDEMHTMMGAGAAEGAIDAANILKPALARGELQCIGATTTKEYKKHIEKDPALERRFQKIVVQETDYEQTIAILRGIISKYEDHHHVKYDDEAITSAVVLSKRYIQDRHLPDKAIDCIDEAGARKRIEGEKTPVDIDNLQNEILSLQIEKNNFVIQQRFEDAAAIRDLINCKKEELNAISRSWRTHEGSYSLKVDRNTILSVIQDWTGIQITDSRADNARFLSMESSLKSHIIGQDKAIEVVSRAFRRNRAGIRKGNRPISSFFFVGPTGVGKTELAKVIADFLFHDKNSLIRIDMSEYMEKHAVARLIGSPPGYIGHDEGGQLTEKVRNKPYSVILFDEIEKSHSDFSNILLQILEEGELTDGAGSRVSFKDAVIIMTSNIGNTRFDRNPSIGFNETTSDDHDKYILSEVKKAFNPELINRIDDIVIFGNLSENNIRQIISLQLSDLSKRISDKHIFLEYSESVIDYIARKSFSLEWGAREVRRVIEKDIEDKVASLILMEDITEIGNIRIDVNEDNVVVLKSTHTNELVSHTTADISNG